MALPVHAGDSADQAAQPRTYQAKNHREYQTHVLMARHDRASQQTDDEPENCVSNHVQHLGLMLLSLPGRNIIRPALPSSTVLIVVFRYGSRRPDRPGGLSPQSY